MVLILMNTDVFEPSYDLKFTVQYGDYFCINLIYTFYWFCLSRDSLLILCVYILHTHTHTHTHTPWNTMQPSKRMSSCPFLCRDMDETNTGTEKQTPYVLTHKCELNNENTWTRGGGHHTPEPVSEWGTRGGKALGQIPNVCGA